MSNKTSNPKGEYIVSHSALKASAMLLTTPRGSELLYHLMTHTKYDKENTMSMNASLNEHESKITVADLKDFYELCNANIFIAATQKARTFAEEENSIMLDPVIDSMYTFFDAITLHTLDSLNDLSKSYISDLSNGYATRSNQSIYEVDECTMRRDYYNSSTAAIIISTINNAKLSNDDSNWLSVFLNIHARLKNPNGTIQCKVDANSDSFDRFSKDMLFVRRLGDICFIIQSGVACAIFDILMYRMVQYYETYSK